MSDIETAPSDASAVASATASAASSDTESEHRQSLLDDAIDCAAEYMNGARTAVLTGAGVSTDSGIPDYRGEGAPVRTPMTVQMFLTGEHARKRYWAGSHLGWRTFRAAQPNAGHRALARLERHALVTGVITQNVDALHARAGSRRIVELHGGMDRVLCLDCGQRYAREAIAERLDELNPGLTDPGAVELSPDGDVEFTDIDQVRIPTCTVCGGMLKPEVVFFGEFVPPTSFARAAAIVARSDALLIAGSSLVVNTGIRLVEIARRAGKPIVIVNRGATKGDGRALLRIDAGTSEVLAGLAERLIP